VAEKRRFLDVWITESNTVYREVPYTVVVDWIQQGRLVADDQLRWSGQAQWFRLGGVPSFSAYLPRSEPMRVEDEAEALERVEVDFSWKRRPEDEDDDVDMIPLIDVSLVLLIFFILTAAGVTATTAIATPFAKYGDLLGNKDMIWVGIDREDGQPVYSVGVEDDEDKQKIKALDEDKHLKSLQDLLQRLDGMLAEVRRPMKVNLKANKDLPSKEVMRVVVELEKRRRVILDKYLGVSETGE
jgi:biopolymer transport protein ExbD